MRSRSFLARRVRNVVVYVHSEQPPTDAEWDAVIDYCRESDLQRACCLVYTQGGAPNAAQRARLSVAFGNIKVPTAVLTASTLARAAGVAVGWFNPRLRIYGPGEIEKALDHLGIAEDERKELRRTLAELKHELGISPARANA